MTLTANLRIGTGIALANVAFAGAVLALPGAAAAQILDPMTEADIRALPSQYQSGPVINDFEEVTVAPDGTETITRTRRIETDAPYPHSYSAPATSYPTYVDETVHTYAPAHAGHAGGYGYSSGYAPGAAVFQRDQWIDECERRTSRRGDREKGGIIGSLLGAITGGIIGNRVAGAGDRLGGTLIGGGVGALGGLVLGQLIGGGRNDRGEYDCEAALDSYLSQYGHPVAHGAIRTIPAQGYVPGPNYHGAHHSYGYAPGYHSYGYSYAPPHQIVYVPIEYQQQQRVIVRETIREEVIPGAVREVPARAPIPVKGPAPRPAPPRYIKGN